MPTFRIFHATTHHWFDGEDFTACFSQAHPVTAPSASEAERLALKVCGPCLGLMAVPVAMNHDTAMDAYRAAYVKANGPGSLEGVWLRREGRKFLLDTEKTIQTTAFTLPELLLAARRLERKAATRNN